MPLLRSRAKKLRFIECIYLSFAKPSLQIIAHDAQGHDFALFTKLVRVCVGTDVSRPLGISTPERGRDTSVPTIDVS